MPHLRSDHVRTAAHDVKGQGASLLLSPPVGSNFVAKRACKCGPPPAECIAPTEVLTQYGKAGDFRSSPNFETGEVEMSLLRGLFTPHAAARTVRGSRLSDAELTSAGARYTTAGRLRKAGFAVVHTPLSVKKPDHVSVVWPDDDPLNRQDVPWPKPVVDAFNECFNDNMGSGRS